MAVIHARSMFVKNQMPLLHARFMFVRLGFQITEFGNLKLILKRVLLCMMTGGFIRLTLCGYVRIALTTLFIFVTSTIQFTGELTLLPAFGYAT